MCFWGFFFMYIINILKLLKDVQINILKLLKDAQINILKLLKEKTQYNTIIIYTFIYNYL